MEKTEWIYCPVCKNKTRDKIRGDTILKNYPLYCPKCNVLRGCGIFNQYQVSDKINTPLKN